ncbi:GntR family transcriptional regulator [Thermostilla marina]
MFPLTLRQQAYERLKDFLLRGELRAGMQLSEPELARRLGMSRTPVREALRQMENEGLIEYAPRFGAAVRVPHRKELEEMYAVREVLESFAAAEAAVNITAEELARLEATFDEMREIADAFRARGEPVLAGEALEKFVALDIRFHRTVIDAARNRYMSKILEDTRLLVRVFTATFWEYDRPKLDEAERFHRRLVEAMNARDAEAARTATVEAMRVARQNAVTAWEAHQQTEA